MTGPALRHRIDIDLARGAPDRTTPQRGNSAIQTDVPVPLEAMLPWSYHYGHKAEEEE